MTGTIEDAKGGYQVVSTPPDQSLCRPSRGRATALSEATTRLQAVLCIRTRPRDVTCHQGDSAPARKLLSGQKLAYPLDAQVA